jgi:hypothetical protein
MAGGYKPTNNFTKVVFPEPDGPTNATVSPCLIEKFIFLQNQIKILMIGVL